MNSTIIILKFLFVWKRGNNCPNRCGNGLEEEYLDGFCQRSFGEQKYSILH